LWPAAATILLGILLAFLACLAALRDRTRAALIVSFGWLLTISFGPLHELLWFNPFFRVRGRYLIAAEGLLWLAAWVALRRTRRNLQALERGLDRFAVTALLVALAWAGAAAARQQAAPTIERRPIPPILFEDASADRAPAPDIYFIILDMYAGAQVLKQLYGHDNSPLLAYLTGKGFYLARNSTSNYTGTWHSIPATLNMEYLHTLLRPVSIDGSRGSGSRSLLPLRDLVRRSRVVQLLKQHFGYRFIAFQSGFSFTECPQADEYFSLDRRPLGELEEHLLAQTPVPHLWRGLQVGWDPLVQRRQRVRFTLAELPRVAEIAGPTFAFAHILCPHPPFIFDAQGGMPNSGSFQQKYAAQVQYIGQQVQQLVEQILQRSKRPPIIVIQGDHGLDWPRPNRSVDPVLRREARLSILNAILLPNRRYGWLYPNITSVNTFRGILRSSFGARIELLPDRWFFKVGGVTSYSFVERRFAPRLAQALERLGD